MNRQKSSAPVYAPLFPYLAARRNAGLLAEGELVIDNFAGIGGASTGMEAALGRPVDHAINHDPVAVSLHRVNHPHSHHSVEDVWQVDPREVTGGQRVALAWFSPDCKHFSKAKGGPLVDRGIRGLAWVAVRWAAVVCPLVIILENVEEFRSWSPLKRVTLPNGKIGHVPDDAQKGRTFNSFVNALRYQGYQVEHRELRACDYGSPTIRRRLFLIARCDGLPIVWPEPTHAAPTDPRVKAGLLQPYRTAAECIDWSLPAPSIFDRKKPLVRNTLNRVAQGLRRFVLESAEPFIVTCNHSGEGFRGQSLGEPFRTITAAHEAHGLTRPYLVRTDMHQSNSGCVYPVERPLTTITTAQGHAVAQPVLAPCVVNKQHHNPPRAATEPLSTITTNHNKNELVQGYLVPRYGEREGQPARAVSVEQPSPTVVCGGNGSRLAIAHLTKFNTGSVGQNVETPITTVMAGGSPARESTGNPHGLVVGQLLTYYGTKRAGETRGQNGTEPLRTQTTENRHAVVAAHLVQHNGGSLPPQDASYPADRPARTVLAQGGPQAVVTGALLGIDNASSTASAWNAEQPLTTIVTEARHGLVSGALVACGGRGAQARPKALDETMHTVTAKADMTLTTAHLTAYYSRDGEGDPGQPADLPLRTIPTVARFGPVRTTLAPSLTPEQFARARQVHDFLAEFLGDALTPYSQDGLVVLQVRGEWYVLADIGMRMLEPRELARCQGFPENYVLAQTAEGKSISKARQVRGIGNSVCPQLAEVLTRAQLGAVQQEAAD